MSSAATDLVSSGIAIAYLGPPGTYTEAATLGYAEQFMAQEGQNRAQYAPIPASPKRYRLLLTAWWIWR